MHNAAVEVLKEKESDLTFTIGSYTQESELLSKRLERTKAELFELKRNLKDVQDALSMLKQAKLYGG